MGICDGIVGSGKSTILIRLLNEIDPTFNEETIRERLILSPLEFSEKLTNKTAKRGTAWLVDEAGSSLSSYQWHNDDIIRVVKFIQLFRHRGLIVFFSVPHVSFVAKGVRKMFDVKIKALKIDFKRHTNTFLAHKITGWNERKNDWYLSGFHNGGEKHSFFRRKAPPKALMKAYDQLMNQKKTEIEEQLRDEMLAKKAMAEQKLEADKGINEKAILDWAKEQDKVTISKIRVAFPMSYHKASVWNQKIKHAQTV